MSSACQFYFVVVLKWSYNVIDMLHKIGLSWKWDLVLMYKEKMLHVSNIACNIKTLIVTFVFYFFK